MSAPSCLKLENISKSFASSRNNGITHALGCVNLEIHQGEFVSIVGPSGCGKSTILRLTSGLIVPTTGSISLNGKNINGTDPERGIIFQKPALFPWLTVEDNVSFSLRMMKKLKGKENDVNKFLAMAGLSEFRKAYPHQLSGGMAQRVALIRTMINEPQVFLLDEPLGALDAFTRMNMQQELINMWSEKKHIMVMVTHDVDEAIYMGTRVIVMTPRPGSIHADIKIDLDYPRQRTSDKFLEYRKKIMKLLNFDHKIN